MAQPGDNMKCARPRCGMRITDAQIKARLRHVKLNPKYAEYKGPYCSVRCVGLNRRAAPVPCVVCGEGVSLQHLSSWKWRGHKTGPFCSNACHSEDMKVWASKKDALAAWEMDRKANGICIECGGGHDRGTYRCRKCTTRSYQRSKARENL